MQINIITTTYLFTIYRDIKGEHKIDFFDNLDNFDNNQKSLGKKIPCSVLISP